MELKEGDKIKVTKDAYPSAYRGKTGVVAVVSDMFPEDITIELDNGALIITIEDRYLEKV